MVVVVVVSHGCLTSMESAQHRCAALHTRKTYGSRSTTCGLVFRRGDSQPLQYIDTSSDGNQLGTPPNSHTLVKREAMILAMPYNKQTQQTTATPIPTMGAPKRCKKRLRHRSHRTARWLGSPCLNSFSVSITSSILAWPTR